MNLIKVSRALFALALVATSVAAGSRPLCVGDESPATPTATTSSPTSTPETTAASTLTPEPSTLAPTVTPTPTTVAPTVTPAPTSPPVTPVPTSSAEVYCSPSDASYAKCVAALSKSTPLDANTDFTAQVTWQYTGSTLPDCIEGCSAQAGCLGYAFLTNLAWCYQYAILGDKYESAGGVTGAILAPKSSCSLSLNAEFVGYDLSESEAQSFEVCCTRCQQTTGCSAFTFTPDSICKLKASTAGKQTNAYFTSGIPISAP